MQISVEILRTNGQHETLTIEKGRGLMRAIAEAIGALPGGLGTVNLRDGRVMLIDDNGYVTEERIVSENPLVVKLVPMAAKKPPNADATQLYWNICRPGTTHQIVGDAAVVWDRDFA